MLTYVVIIGDTDASGGADTLWMAPDSCGFVSDGRKGITDRRVLLQRRIKKWHGAWWEKWSWQCLFNEEDIYIQWEWFSKKVKIMILERGELAKWCYGRAKSMVMVTKWRSAFRYASGRRTTWAWMGVTGMAGNAWRPFHIISVFPPRSWDQVHHLRMKREKMVLSFRRDLKPWNCTLDGRRAKTCREEWWDSWETLRNILHSW